LIFQVFLLSLLQRLNPEIHHRIKMVCVLPCPGKEFSLIGINGIGTGTQHGDVHADAAAGLSVLERLIDTFNILIFIVSQKFHVYANGLIVSYSSLKKSACRSTSGDHKKPSDPVVAESATTVNRKRIFDSSTLRKS
jgi:hypothetical protein